MFSVLIAKYVPAIFTHNAAFYNSVLNLIYDASCISLAMGWMDKEYLDEPKKMECI